MVEALALRIARALKRIEPEKTASIDVMKFALEAIINALITIVFIAIIGMITGKPGETLLGFAAFALLRFFSGGLHLKSAMHCSIISAVLISIAPHIPLTANVILIIQLLSLVLILIYSPSNIEGHARIPPKYFFILKIVSAIIVSSNLFFMSSTLCVVFAIQALTLIEFRRR